MTSRQLLRQLIIFAISTFLAIASSIVIPSFVKAQSIKPDAQILISGENQTNLHFGLKKKNPDFSGDGRPGRRIGGGSRNPCPSVNFPLTALMPETNSGKTIAAHPTFSFYVPYSLQQISLGEFVLQEVEGNDVYRLEFALPKKPGIVSLGVPATKTPLEKNKLYRWYFKLYCKSQESSTPIFVEGWVQRVATTSHLEKQLQAAEQEAYTVYAENDLWYDAIALLIELRQAYPSDARLDRAWVELLSSKGVNLQTLGREPIAGKLVARYSTLQPITN
jgi:hypothetical protein